MLTVVAGRSLFGRAKGEYSWFFGSPPRLGGVFNVTRGERIPSCCGIAAKGDAEIEEAQVTVVLQDGLSQIGYNLCGARLVRLLFFNVGLRPCRFSSNFFDFDSATPPSTTPDSFCEFKVRASFSAPSNGGVRLRHLLSLLPLLVSVRDIKC